MKAAVIEVVNNNRSKKSVAMEFGVDRRTLRRYVKKYVSAERRTLRRYVKKYVTAESKDEVKFVPKYHARRVFSDDEEIMLADYLIKATNHNYGLSPVMCRRLAYEFAYANNKQLPDAWIA